MMIAARFVGGSHRECPSQTVERRGGPSVFIVVNGYVVTGQERGRVIPGPFLIGHKVDAPFVAVGGARFRCIAVGRVVTGNTVDLAPFGESHIEATVAERAGRRGFAGVRSCEGDCDLVPLLQFA